MAGPLALLNGSVVQRAIKSVMALMAGLGFSHLRSLWFPKSDAHVGEQPDINVQLLQSGFDRLSTLFDHQSVIVQLAVAAIFVLLIPHRNWIARAVLLALAFAAVAIAAATVGDKIRPRYFIPVSLAFPILVAALLHCLDKLRWWWVPRSTIVGLLLLSLFFDSIAFHSSWSDLMSSLSGTAKHTLIDAPRGWKERYGKMKRLMHDDHSTIGSKALHQLSSDHGKSVVYGVPLRDGREYHLSAASSAALKKYRIIKSNICCKNTYRVRFLTEVSRLKRKPVDTQVSINYSLTM